MGEIERIAEDVYPACALLAEAGFARIKTLEQGVLVAHRES